MLKDRVTVAIAQSTRDRLKTRYAKYGDTLDTIIVELLDFNDKWKGVVDNVKFQDGDKLE